MTINDGCAKNRDQKYRVYKYSIATPNRSTET